MATIPRRPTTASVPSAVGSGVGEGCAVGESEGVGEGSTVGVGWGVGDALAVDVGPGVADGSSGGGVVGSTANTARLQAVASGLNPNATASRRNALRSRI